MVDKKGSIINSIETGAIPISLIQDRRLNLNDIRIYTYLKIRQGLSSYSFPRISTIVNDTFVSRSTVFRSLKRLELYGWISKTYREGTSNLYKCNIIPFSYDFVVPLKRKTKKKSSTKKLENTKFIEFNKIRLTN